jgi:hydrogenase expression/formation protein HypE
MSGPIGRHGIAIMAVRENFAFDSEIRSDSANLYPLVGCLEQWVGEGIHVMRDPTRGGVASALNEIADAAQLGIVLEEDALPIDGPVAAACEMLGFDPLYVANEGMLVAFVAPEWADEAVETMRSHPLGRHATRVGRVVRNHPGTVVLETMLGATRVVDMLPGDQLPRIC